MRKLLTTVARQLDRSLQRPVSLVGPGGERRGTEDLGRQGEQLAQRWLRLEGGCKILYRNFKAPDGGEVDIVCRHEDILVFAEVKTRTSELFGRPATAVTPDKRKLIIRGAREWLRLLDKPRTPFRFDIIEILLFEGSAPDINWLQGAFQLSHPFLE
ncbi:MAG: YraN family protein [Verrucomicrobiales bacterium]